MRETRAGAQTPGKRASTASLTHVTRSLEPDRVTMLRVSALVARELTGQHVERTCSTESVTRELHRPSRGAHMLERDRGT